MPDSGQKDNSNNVGGKPINYEDEGAGGSLPWGPAGDGETISGQLDILDRKLFDEAAYLRLNPDVAQSVARGDVASGYSHYVLHGFREGRVTALSHTEPRNRLLKAVVVAGQGSSDAAGRCEALIASMDGGIFVVGWLDDFGAPLRYIRISGPCWRILLDEKCIVRTRRQDVEQALGKPVVHSFGYLGFVYTGELIETSGMATVEFWLGDGRVVRQSIPCQVFDDQELRNTLLAIYASTDFFGSPHVERVTNLDFGLGDQIIEFNRAITNKVCRSPYVERFGEGKRKYKGTIVVCLYGKAEYLFVQNALYSGLPGIEDYEFVYVSNSPELGEVLMREARIGSRVYGIDQTIMVLTGNAGFGAANNIAAQMAQSERIMIVNPDVFPRDKDWARKHTEIIESEDISRTRLFGAPLYYDDGSLMHGGMFFELDNVISTRDSKFTRRRLVRVEHYGKGAPPETSSFLQARPVPAVTGAFISCERDWYEKLGGFTEDFVFGHYEDADLCLKSLQAGTPAWMQDLRLWHLEGKGSTRLPPHEGGSIVNRWLFAERWSDIIEDKLLGPNVMHSAGLAKEQT